MLFVVKIIQHFLKFFVQQL